MPVHTEPYSQCVPDVATRIVVSADTYALKCTREVPCCIIRDAFLFRAYQCISVPILTPLPNSDRITERIPKRKEKMVLRYNENKGTAGANTLNGVTGGIFFGLQGNDTFLHPSWGGFLAYVGGSGNDHYSMGSNPGLMTVAETSGAADRITATGMGVLRSTTFFATIDSRHLYAFDTASGQGVLQIDWLNPAHRIETITLSDGTYSFDQIIAFMQTSPNGLGNYTWNNAISSNLLRLPPGATAADLSEALTFYKNRAIAFENPQFAWTNTQTQQSLSNPAPSYSGPVSYLDLQFLGSNQGEAIAGTAFSDFVNAGGGDDAIASGEGDDVLDGGTGSNFLTGGAGWDIFFIDGRGGQVTWGTITDWVAGEQLSLWGWLPGVSRVTWADRDGTAGFQGVTLHADLNGNGSIDASVTFTGITRGELPTSLEFDGLLWFK